MGHARTSQNRSHCLSVADFPVHDRVPFSEVRAISDLMTRHFLEGTIDTIEVIYPRFRNTLVQEPRVRPVLPLHSVREFIENLTDETAGTRQISDDDREILFEPDVHQVLAAMLPCG